ncbi:helix-turn-helix domain-containing protein [Paenibacillus sp. EC2-1]|uniref:AraC family transcriptional regulator n=1 Tax=Paenibacillus sp. EC2-1 TaxID=3388665 RepID=UPI003BEEF938
MEPFRKPFYGDPLFPFHLIHRTLKFPNNELPDHLHDLYELVYIHEGNGTFFIDKSLYDKQPGDLFIIPGNTVHRSIPDEADPIISTAVFFGPTLAGAGANDDSYSLLQCFDFASKHKIYKFALPDPLRFTIESTLDVIQEEYKLQQQGYRAAIRLELGKLLLQLNRYLNQHFTSQPLDNKIGPSWIKSTLFEIDANPELPHSLVTFAERASVSQSHFSRVFKQFTGMNVTDYVNAKRIIRAKELLLQSDDNVSSIAETCGFTSIPHFHRIFKILTNTTPSAYRKKK